MENKLYNTNIKPAERLSHVNEYYFSIKGKEVAQMNAEGKDASSMLSKGVAEYIAKNRLLKREGKSAEVESLITQAKAAYGRNEWGKALNDFNAALELSPDNREAQEYVKMIHEILDFRYKDIYNP